MDSPLRKLGDRVLLSPHSASYTEGGELRQGVAWATRSVLTALKGGIPDNVYNRDVIPRWKERFGGASVSAARAAVSSAAISGRRRRDFAAPDLPLFPVNRINSDLSHAFFA